MTSPVYFIMNPTHEINRVTKEKYRALVYKINPDGTKSIDPLLGALPFANVNTAKNAVYAKYPRAILSIRL